jgi:membrane protease YdiL (CAAX protease family)
VSTGRFRRTPGQTPDVLKSAPQAAPRTRVGLALAGWLLVATLQILAAFGLQGSADEPAGEPLYSYDLAIGSFLIYGFLLALTFALATLITPARMALGLGGFARRWVWIAFGVAVASLVVSAALEPILHAGEEQGLTPDVWRPDRIGALVVNSILIVTLVPFAEELFFRGLGVSVLRHLGAGAAVVGTGVIFALAHGIWEAVPPLLFFAIGLAWVRLRSESVWPGVIAHATYNGIGIAAAISMLAD